MQRLLNQRSTALRATAQRAPGGHARLFSSSFPLSSRLIRRKSAYLAVSAIGGGVSCTSSLAAAVCESRRCKGFHFFINLDDPEVTRLRVEEDLEKLASEEKKDSTAYLHSLLNLTLSHYQREDFVAAHEMALLTHNKALAHNAKSSLVYFTATTTAQCSEALATAYDAHVRSMEERAITSSTLAPAPSVVFGAKRTIAKLRADAKRYRVIAHRILHRPDMAYMRGTGDGKGGGRRNWNSSRQTAGSDTRYAWQEDSSNSGVDEEYASHAYGEQWQAQRKRPEHAEVKHYYKRQYTPAPTTASSVRKWTVPK